MKWSIINISFSFKCLTKVIKKSSLTSPSGHFFYKKYFLKKVSIIFDLSGMMTYLLNK
jgi:hypothetical protein